MLDDSSTSVDPTTTTSTTACIPGQQLGCPCPEGPEGTQTCAADGSGFDACECEPIDPPADSTGTSDTGTDTTTGTGTTGTTGDLETTDTGTSDGSASVCDDYVAMPGAECDLWLQNCPATEKCMPWANDGGSSWNAVRCSPLSLGPDQLGDPCVVDGSGTSGIDSCDLGLMCWDVDADTNLGTCIGLCTGCPEDFGCPGVGAFCTITNNGILPVCLPGCDPLLQNCAPGQGCYPVGETFTCAPDASGAGGAYGDPCEFINVCDPGLFCVGTAAVPPGQACTGAAGCCTEACDLGNPFGDAQCAGFAGGQVCLAWYEVGMVPAGYEDVGVCSIP